MSVVLADIGGTHARFATLENGAPVRIEKFAVARFSNLQDALAAYTNDKGAAYIATAAWPWPDGTWRFAREGRWIIDPRALEGAGWKVAYIGNDFGAGARGALSLTPDLLHSVQPKGANDIAQDRHAVLGSGTGLGLAYVHQGRIHETYGGQMEVPQRTDEQHTIINLVQRLKGNDRPVTAEDVVSGPGMLLLYNAAGLLHGRKPDDADFAAIMESAADPLCAHALRLYHEFLGMFAQQAVIYGHAYAGLYLDGGVLHSLIGKQLFDTGRFLRFFTGDPIPLIKGQLQAMPVNIITDPYVALRGLAEMANDAS